MQTVLAEMKTYLSGGQLSRKDVWRSIQYLQSVVGALAFIANPSHNKPEEKGPGKQALDWINQSAQALLDISKDPQAGVGGTLPAKYDAQLPTMAARLVLIADTLRPILQKLTSGKPNIDGFLKSVEPLKAAGISGK